ncbi:MAG: YaeQ family protein [Gammaproteobacteria bacterium]|nr:YaeQ family protein [Gammaproteobacteria bacterium]
MALKSTIFKVALNVADMDRHLYDDFSRTVARHPSETDERMMLRIAAFALHANEDLTFGKGLSTDDEPDLWRRSLSSEIELWVELGMPNHRRLRKACSRAEEVVVYCYGGRAVTIWWDKCAPLLSRFQNLKVYDIDATAAASLAAFAEPNMALQCSIEGGELLVSCPDGRQVTIAPIRLN